MHCHFERMAHLSPVRGRVLSSPPFAEVEEDEQHGKDTHDDNWRQYCRVAAGDHDVPQQREGIKDSPYDLHPNDNPDPVPDAVKPSPRRAERKGKSRYPHHPIGGGVRPHDLREEEVRQAIERQEDRVDQERYLESR